ncbi:MAG: hypothetical protein Q8P18_14785 [Pseudomonadota bacterium]|nr:hypothetical protein [Pseudomonadota bacterium]
MSVPWAQQVEEVVASVLMLARPRGRLAAVRIGVPPDIAAEPVIALLRSRLAACGHPGLEVVTLLAAGPMRLLSAEFER